MNAMQVVVAELQKVHRLSEKDAASIALTVASVVNMEVSGRGLAKSGKCPFDDDKFFCRPDEPCPVCGDLGNDGDAVPNCVNYRS